MAIAGNLSVALSLNSARFRSGLDRARQQSTTFSQRVTRTLGRVRAGFGGIQTAIVGVGAALGAGQLLNTADDLIKLADATGFGFESLQRLQFGFEQAGIQQSDFQRGIRTFSRAYAEAAQGVPTYVEALEAIGLSYDQLEGLSPEERFLSVVDAVSAVEDPTLRAASAQELLGRGFASVRVGADSVVEAGEGIVTINEEQGRAAEELNDTFNRLTTNLRNITINVLVPLLEAITPVAERFSDFAQENPQLATLAATLAGLGASIAVVGGPVTAVAVAIGLGIAAWQNWDTVVSTFSDLWASFSNTFPELSMLITSAIDGLVTAFNFIRDAFTGGDGVSSAAQTVGDVFRALGEVIGTYLVTQVENLASIFNSVIDVFAGLLNGDIDAVREGFTGIGNGILNFLLAPLQLAQDAFTAILGVFGDFSFTAIINELRVGALGIIVDLVTQIAEVIEQIPGIGGRAGQGFRDNFLAPVQEAYQEAVGGSIVPDMVREIGEWMIAVPQIAKEAGEGFRNEFILGLELTADDAERVTNDINSAGMRAFDGLTNALTDFVTTGMADFGAFAQSIIQDLIRIQIRAALLSFIPGGNLFAGAFAEGGRIPAGQFGLVGEAGPEFVRGPANVTSAADTADILNGQSGGGNITVQVSAIDARSFTDTVMQPRFAEALNNAVNSNQRRMGVT